MWVSPAPMLLVEVAFVASLCDDGGYIETAREPANLRTGRKNKNIKRGEASLQYGREFASSFFWHRLWLWLVSPLVGLISAICMFLLLGFTPHLSCICLLHRSVLSGVSLLSSIWTLTWYFPGSTGPGEVWTATTCGAVSYPSRPASYALE